MNADAYIGKPWKFGAAGPDAFDCWGLFAHASRALYGITVPSLAATIQGRRRWKELKEPRPGCAVVLEERTGRAYHVGLYIGGGLVLHTSEHFGARLESVRAMSSEAAGVGLFIWEP